MTPSFSELKKIFFIGIAGSGMSALAQYVKDAGKEAAGSDRYFLPGKENDIRTRLGKAGVQCYPQDGSGIQEGIDLVVISTAVEDSVPEVRKAKEQNIPIIRRSELLALIAAEKKTIAIAGTSGKSTTSAMLFEILEHAGIKPGIITGAGLVSLINKGLIGNAKNGEGDWLVIEADESDGSIVQYGPEIGVLLNVEKDHKEIDDLLQLFEVFKKNSRRFIVNRSNHFAKLLSTGSAYDFSGSPGIPAGYMADQFRQDGLQIEFTINGYPFSLYAPGKHNMENALAAVATACELGVSIETCAEALRSYQGIYRRHQVYGNKKGVWLIDDFAHNPVKCAASIRACQPLTPKVIAWFQPHGYGPTRFLRDEFVREISAVLRDEDEIWMSEIYYAGGSAEKDISAGDIVHDLRQKGANAFFVSNRSELPAAIRSHLTDNCVLLLMGARDPSLEEFAEMIWQQL